ncbi:MAG: sugar phosphate isomerase/epimerase [Spirosomataceae bacterium]
MQTRRHFLKTIGASAAIASLNNGVTAAPVLKKIGLQLYTVRDDIGKDLEGTLRKVAGIGYKEVELAGYGNGAFYGKSTKDFKALLSDLGLSSPSGHYTTGNHDKNLKGTLLNGWEKAVEDAAELGHQYMVCAYLFPNERKKLDDYKRFVDLFSKSAEVCKKSGIQFCYHNHDFEFQQLEGQLPIDIILGNTDKNLVKMELDLYWVTRAGHDPVEFMKKHAGRFPLWHIKDMENTPEKAFAEVGRGTIDFKRIFAVAQAAGAKHFMVEQDVCKRPPLESIEISYKYLAASKF